MAQAPVLSPVDYAAWERGYMPPSEHILIDALSYRGAKVVMSSSGPDGSVYVVMQGKRPDKRMRLALRQLLETFDEIDQDEAAFIGPRQPPDQSRSPAHD